MSLRAKSKYVPAGRPAANAGVTLYCTAGGVGCHWVRLVLAEKGVEEVRIEVQLPGMPSEDLATLNPSGSLPTLTDRDAVIYPARLIAEFLDERHPHPPMMPPEAALRARLRMFMLMLETQWLPLLEEAGSESPARAKKLRAQLAAQLAAHARLFPARGWFLGLEFGLADCALAALLWQLASLKLQLPASCAPILRYAERAFSRPAFARSLAPGQRGAAPGSRGKRK